ncbi:MAG: SDR family oxidoreductase [Myxococcales bacterium]|nr:SDR family oxidoreductase [Myxococcales bacterium]
MNMKDKVVLITGGGYGIGRQIARAFGEAGAFVIVAARSLEKLESVAAEVKAQGGRARAVALDVTRAEEVEQLIADVSKTQGQLDVLVNNSGIGGPTALARDVSLEEWTQTLEVNLSGAFYCAKYASKVMIDRGQGCIVNIGSVASRIGFAHRTAYAASKWGLLGLSHSLAAELGPYGIRVNAVLPGLVDGERFGGVMANRAKLEQRSKDDVLAGMVAQTPLKRLVSEKEVADAVLYLASDAASGITGQALNVCGGFRMQ